MQKLRIESMKDISQNPLQLAKSLSDYWSPQIIAEINDTYVKVAKLKGQLVWHSHDDEDEMFVILQGELVIEFRDKKVNLTTGDIYVIPKNVEHNPVADNECLVMLVEKKSTLHTGKLVNKNSKSIRQQLGLG